MPILEKIRGYPESKRKKIIWITIFLVAIMLIVFWILNLKYNFPEIDFTNFKGPSVNSEDFKEAGEGINDFQKNVQEKTKDTEKDVKEK